MVQSGLKKVFPCHVLGATISSTPEQEKYEGKKKFNISLPSSQLETLCQPHLLCRLDEPDKARAWGDKKTEGSCDIMAPRSHNRK